MKKSIFGVLTLLHAFLVNAQTDEGLFDRLQGFTHGEYKFFNTDGIEITAIPMEGTFTPKSISKKYRQYHLKASDITGSDTLLSSKNYYMSKVFERGFEDYYFLWHGERLIGFSFASRFTIDRQLERDLIELFIAGKIPGSIYQPMQPSNVNFAGREIETRGCRWMNPNNLQCPYNGQINWSSFKTQEAAQRALNDHYDFLANNQRGKVLLDEQVDVIFEGQEVKARKVVFDFTGVTSILVATSGGKTLTIYMVVANVRNKYLEAVMSHWNNDRVSDETGLPALHTEVMRLK